MRTMQIASACKSYPCDACEVWKENNPSAANERRSAEKSRKRLGCNSRPQRNSGGSRARPARLRQRHAPSGNQHRLDHTYAAATVASLGDNTGTGNIVIVIDDDEDENEEEEEEDREARPVKPVARLAPAPDEPEDIGLKSSWLRNLCLEYQPPAKLPRTRENAAACEEKRASFDFAGLHAPLKQYQRHRKVNKSKLEHSTSFLSARKISNPAQEENKRWIAALALIELAQSK